VALTTVAYLVKQ
jgi:hypothetical protein